MDRDAIPPDVAALARADGRTIMEALAHQAFEVVTARRAPRVRVPPIETWVPQAARIVIGPVRPLSYDEAMDARVSQMQVNGSDLSARVDYRTLSVVMEYPEPFTFTVTKAGWARWATVLADGCNVPLCVIPVDPGAYVRPGDTVKIEDFRLIG